MPDELFMEMCLSEALTAFEEEEVPVGAVITSGDWKVLASAHNLTIRRNSPLAHAELLAIRPRHRRRSGIIRLVGCTLFVSMEPCLMCAGAIQEARIKRLVFGCFDKKRGAFGSAIDANALPSNHKVEVQGGVLGRKAKACSRSFSNYGGIPKRS